MIQCEEKKTAFGMITVLLVDWIHSYAAQSIEWILPKYANNKYNVLWKNNERPLGIQKNNNKLCSYITSFDIAFHTLLCKLHVWFWPGAHCWLHLQRCCFFSIVLFTFCVVHHVQWHYQRKVSEMLGFCAGSVTTLLYIYVRRVFNED